MQEYFGNIIDLIGEVGAVCITTNMFVKNNGRAVMGKGIARAITCVVENIDLSLGDAISNGEKVCVIATVKNTDIIAFPVKGRGFELNSEYDLDDVVNHMKDSFDVGDFIPGWACKAEPGIIRASCQELVCLANSKEYKNVYVPRPGCGAGELSYNDIKPILEEELDNRFYISTFAR